MINTCPIILPSSSAYYYTKYLYRSTQEDLYINATWGIRRTIQQYTVMGYTRVWLITYD